MTMLFTDGFDAQDTASKWVFATTNTTAGKLLPVYTTTTRFGAGSAVSFLYDSAPFVSTSRITQSFTASAHVFIGAAIKSGIQVGQSYSTPFHAVYTDAGATSHLFLATTTLGAVQLWRGNAQSFPPTGSTMIATSSNAVMDANWHYVELGATIDSTTGTAVVKVDGSTVINFTGNTRNGGTSVNIDTTMFQALSTASVSLGSTAVDDLYVCNALGSVNNTFLGDVRIQTLLPDAAGSSTQFTPTGSGTNYLNANDVPDSVATFNADSVSGHRDTYGLGDVLASTGTVFAVQQVTRALKSDAGAASLKAAQKSGATVSYGATRSLGTSPALYVDVFETNPATSAAYTVSDLNALEAGAEVV